MAQVLVGPGRAAYLVRLLLVQAARHLLLLTRVLLVELLLVAALLALVRLVMLGHVRGDGQKAAARRAAG